jgi:hypothetical protein
VWFEKSRLRRHRGASGAESFRFTRELDPKTEWERDYCTALYGRNVTLSQAPLAFLIFTPVTPQTQRRPLKKAILAARLRRDPPKRQVSRSPGVGFLSAALNRSVTVPPWFLPYRALQYSNVASLLTSQYTTLGSDAVGDRVCSG